MKVIESESNEAKLLEEKRKEMNNLIGLNNISIQGWITLLINDWCKEHIKTLHKEYPHTEWLAICKVEPQWNWIFLMTDMVFPWQKGVGWEVETTKEWMEWFTRELINRGENTSQWNCILHSHHSMGCFWSSTDDNARLSLNDWRQVEWAVVTAYDNEWNIHYKGCINFYKPYNIEIDVNVVDLECEWIVDKYNEYLKKVGESEKIIYNFLLKTNKEHIDSITKKPSYSWILDYLWIDISEELNENYDSLKEKIWNPELVDYMKQLEDKAREMAISEVNTGGVYSDMLAEYGAYCTWSDNLLTQLENNRKQTFEKTYTSSINNPSLYSQTALPLNRDFEDEYNYDDYEFTSNKYSESYIRSMFWIPLAQPMKVGDESEWQVWSEECWDYIYVEEWANDYWD